MTSSAVRVYVRCHGCGLPVEDLVARHFNRQDYHETCLPVGVALCYFCGDAHESRNRKPDAVGFLCKCCEKCARPDRDVERQPSLLAEPQRIKSHLGDHRMKDPDRPFGRDYPILLGICPVCEEDVITEHVMEDDDPQVKKWGEVYFHKDCVPADLRECPGCGFLEEVGRLDFMGNCSNCKVVPQKESA